MTIWSRIFGVVVIGACAVVAANAVVAIGAVIVVITFNCPREAIVLIRLPVDVQFIAVHGWWAGCRQPSVIDRGETSYSILFDFLPFNSVIF